MRYTSVLPYALLGLVSSACSSDEAATPSFAVTDSAGVEVVTTTVAPWAAEGSPWSLVLSTEIGELDGAEPYLFGDVSDVALLPDDGFAVADAQSGDVRFYSDEGDFRGRVGRLGEGPGEFRSFSWMTECGGSLVAYDYRLRRVTTLSTAGEVRDTRPFETPEPGNPPYRSTCAPNGSLIAVGWGDRSVMPTREGVHFYTQPADLWIIGDEPSDTTTVGTYISSERIARFNSSGGGGSSPHPFSRSVAFAANDSLVIIGGAERLQVEIRELDDGALKRIFRGPDADLVIDEDFLGRYAAADLTGRDSLMRSDVARSDFQMPPRYPAYSELMIDDLGYVWVERFVLPWAEERLWGIFDPDGVFLGHIEVPLDFSATDVDVDRLAGIATDEIGVPRVRVYDIVRSRPPSETPSN